MRCLRLMGDGISYGQSSCINYFMLIVLLSLVHSYYAQHNTMSAYFKRMCLFHKFQHQDVLIQGILLVSPILIYIRDYGLTN